MERGSFLRLIFIGVLAFAAVALFTDMFGNGEQALQPLKPEEQDVDPAVGKKKEALCHLWRPEFHAVLGSHGATLKHFYLTQAKYTRDGKQQDLSTTPDLPFYRQLRFDWHNEAAIKKDAATQVAHDLLNYQLIRWNERECVFRHRSGQADIVKTIRTTDRPYELLVEAKLTNLSDKSRKHALTVHTTAWRKSQETKGEMFRVSPYITHVECVQEGGSTTRLRPEDFGPAEFEEEPQFRPSLLNPGDWYQPEGTPDVAAVSNAYFTHAVVPLEDQKSPSCQLQIEYRWNSQRYASLDDDPDGGAMYRARLAYEPATLPAQASRTYEVLSYIGPKERNKLDAAGGGKHQLIELIDLGFFSAIAKILVSFLLKVHSVIPNWGIAIIVLTVVARILLFPLSVPSIKSMIKMRELKPELDALHKKYKDDPQAKGLAQMELWRKHKVNPLKGCLPQLASMPVWFALYTTLQTAVELYNIPFLWFPDLSEADPLFILPFVIGGTTFLQQKLMPMQGDPAQQKMLMYFMPGMFTVFMLFLPSGLGVYMFTNAVLGIVQQQIVERQVRRSSTKGGTGGKDTEVQVKLKDEKPSSKRSKSKKTQEEKTETQESKPRKGKGGAKAKLSEIGLLDKGKA